MSKSQRALNLLVGIFMIPMAILLAYSPGDGYDTIMAVLSIGLLAGGIRSLYYYFTMARHMVDGERSLYIGIIVLDFGIFTASLNEVPYFYVLLYLLGIHLFAGIVDIWAALNSKKLGAASWRLKLSSGLINVIISVLCLVFIGQRNTAVYIYCAGMIYSGIMRIITAFRRTAMVYIQ